MTLNDIRRKTIGGNIENQFSYGVKKIFPNETQSKNKEKLLSKFKIKSVIFVYYYATWKIGTTVVERPWIIVTINETFLLWNFSWFQFHLLLLWCVDISLNLLSCFYCYLVLLLCYFCFDSLAIWKINGSNIIVNDREHCFVLCDSFCVF